MMRGSAIAAQVTSATAVTRNEKEPIRGLGAWRKRDNGPVNCRAVILDNFVVR